MPSNKKEYNKKYYSKNKERLKELVRIWRKNNKGKQSMYNKKYKDKPSTKLKIKMDKIKQDKIEKERKEIFLSTKHYPVYTFKIN